MITVSTSQDEVTRLAKRFTLIAVMAMTLWGAACPAETIVFPEDSGYINVQTKYGAKGDGTTDDTAAFQKAMAEDVRYLLIPSGTYLLSDSIVMGGKRCHWQGESESTTVLKLTDRATGFDNSEQPKPFISTFAAFRDPKANMGQAFRNSLFNLTIDVGAENPGAVGLHYLNNNQGTVRDVTIRSSDPGLAGKAGLALVTNWPGPAYIHRVTIEGFDIGLWSENSQYSFICEQLLLSRQRVVGIENIGQTLSIRKLTSNNSVPAVRTRGAAAMLTLLDSSLIGGGAETTAIEAEEDATLIVERVTTSGYARSIRSTLRGQSREAVKTKVESFLSHPVLPLKTEVRTPTLMSIEETPELALPSANEWVSVAQFGAVPISGKNAPDAGPAIQRAIDAGKQVVYLPQAVYAIRTPVRVRGRVQRIIGMESTLRLLTGDAPAFIIEDGASPVVIFERMQGDYGSDTSVCFEHASTRTLVLRQLMLGGYRNTVKGGQVFLDDVCGNAWNFDGQRVWARQLNTEAKGDGDFNVRCRDTEFWAMCLKTEGPRTVITATGGRVELWGGFFYASRGTDAGAAAIDLTRTAFVGSWVNHLGGSYRPQVRHRAGDRIDELHLNVDFTDRSRLFALYRETQGETTTFEHVKPGGDQSLTRPFRHGSYGVKVPRFVSESSR